MLHAYVQRFDVTGTVQKFLGVFRHLNRPLDETVCKETIQTEPESQQAKPESFFTIPGNQALFSFQFLPQIPLCKKEISHHIKMTANTWSTKCR
jgi:hypothetical protein